MKELQFFEYSGFLDEKGIESDSLASCSLNIDEIQCLRSLSDTLTPGKPIFDINSSKIRATSMVGVISFGGVHIEILPKLLRNRESNAESPNNSILKNLMFMLSYTNSLDINDVGISTLGINSDSFIEAYISIFAIRLSNYLIRFGTPKAYIERCENLNTIRGKISFSKQSTTNFLDQSRVFCDFSEFSEDNGVSRALKFVAGSLSRMTRNPRTLSILNRCNGLLDGVLPAYTDSETLDRLAAGKRDTNFIALINLTKMFLKRLRPEFVGQRNNKVFSILFDMNALFEEFIFQVLKKNEVLLGIEVTAQKKKRLVSAERDFLVSNEWVQKSLFDTYTDISVKPKSGPTFIIDTKYKIVSSSKSHYGISNQDAYQVLAYRQIHKTEGIEPTVALLYPRFTEDLQKEFRVNGSPTTFMAWTIDISRSLPLHLPKLVEDLQSLINPISTRVDYG